MADQDAVARGMKVQMRRFRDALAGGMPRLGWKIGLNDPRMLERLGLESPVVGWLDGAHQLRSGGLYIIPPASRVALEAEVAVRVGGGGAVAAVAPALELVNYSLPANSLEEVLEYDIFHSAVVFGREALPVPIADGVWPIVACNGREVGRRDPTQLVLQPTDMVRHVAATLARYGETLETGDWLILGTLIQPVSVRAGDRVEADFGPLGRVSVEIWK